MLDAGFTPGSSDLVRTLAIETNAQILVGGEFRTFNREPRRGIARLNSDGSLDEGFNPGDPGYWPVYAVLPKQDGNILIGGAFDRTTSPPRRYLAQLRSHGELDTTFDPGTGF